jgi:hypothetical protein
MHKTTVIDTNSEPVIAQSPAPTVSPRYSFVPTRDIVQGLERAGWAFDSGTVRRTRRPELAPYALHLLRFSHPTLPVLADGTRPQAVLVNSHSGASAFRLLLGAFRIACANGLVVQSTDAGALRLRHYGLDLPEIVTATGGLLEQAPKVFARLSDWSRIDLSRARQEELAARCRALRWDASTHVVSMNALLAVRRRSDVGDDLWRVFNRLQEAVVRGGVPVRSIVPGSRERLARAVTGPSAQLKLNQDLWRIAEEVAFAS